MLLRPFYNVFMFEQKGHNKVNQNRRTKGDKRKIDEGKSNSRTFHPQFVS